MADEEEKCSICDEPIVVGETPFDENTCGLHYAHTRCIRTEADGDYECRVCNAPISYPSLEELRASEGNAYDEDEEVAIQLPSVGIVGSMKRMTSGWLRDNVKTSTNPFFLLSQKYPVFKLLSVKKMGLVHLVNNNSVSLDEFVKHGYTLDDLKGFPQIASQEDGLDTLIGMGLTTYHLVGTREIDLHREELIDYYGLTPGIIIDELGFEFVAPKDGGWLLGDYINYKFRMDDLIEAGLTYKWEWEDLIEGYSPEDVEKLGATKEHLDALMTIQRRRRRAPRPSPQIVIEEVTSEDSESNYDQKQRGRRRSKPKRREKQWCKDGSVVIVGERHRSPPREVGVAVMEKRPPRQRSNGRRRKKTDPKPMTIKIVEPPDLFNSGSKTGRSMLKERK